MSFEVLLLLFVFLVLPLIEGMVRKARIRREQAEGRSAPGRQAPREGAPPVRRPPPPPAWDDDEEEEDEVVVVARPQAPPPLPPVRPPMRQPARPPVHRAPAPVRATAAMPAELVLARRARDARLQRATLDQREREHAHRRRPHARTIRALSRPSSVRAAIVLSTVLGPCRANDPYS
ncbi:MAG: hypothetical protein Q8L86_14530 [Vicinamibacterales bacterium]|nr:hypothetical protein [Vicinamibacterales bacterium]